MNGDNRSIKRRSNHVILLDNTPPHKDPMLWCLADCCSHRWLQFLWDICSQVAQQLFCRLNWYTIRDGAHHHHNSRRWCSCSDDDGKQRESIMLIWVSAVVPVSRTDVYRPYLCANSWQHGQRRGSWFLVLRFDFLWSRNSRRIRYIYKLMASYTHSLAPSRLAKPHLWKASRLRTGAVTMVRQTNLIHSIYNSNTQTIQDRLQEIRVMWHTGLSQHHRSTSWML